MQQLRLGSVPGGLRTFVTRFDRTNLHFSVAPKAGGLEAALRPLADEARRLAAAGRAPPATLVYCPTTAEVDAVEAFFKRAGVAAAGYHAKKPAEARAAAHAAFLRDDAVVMAATVAYGMVRAAFGGWGCLGWLGWGWGKGVVDSGACHHPPPTAFNTTTTRHYHHHHHHHPTHINNNHRRSAGHRQAQHPPPAALGRARVARGLLPAGGARGARRPAGALRAAVVARRLHGVGGGGPCLLWLVCCLVAVVAAVIVFKVLVGSCCCSSAALSLYCMLAPIRADANPTFFGGPHTHGRRGANIKQQTTNNKQQTTNNKHQTTNNKQQTTNNKQQTTNNKQQTTNNKQQTTNNNKQQTTNNKQQHTTNNKQQTTNNKQQTTNNKQQHTHTRMRAQKMDFIKSSDGGLGSAATRDAHARGIAAMRGYCASAACRHAALVNYFEPGGRGGGGGGGGRMCVGVEGGTGDGAVPLPPQAALTNCIPLPTFDLPALLPGSLPESGPCAGGCDACDAAREAAEGGGAGGGAAALERDVTDEARLLLAAVEAIRVRALWPGGCRAKKGDSRLGHIKPRLSSTHHLAHAPPTPLLQTPTTTPSNQNRVSASAASCRCCAAPRRATSSPG